MKRTVFAVGTRFSSRISRISLRSRTVSAGGLRCAYSHCYPAVRQDIVQLLEISVDDQFIASFDRENLFISVQSKDQVRLQVIEFLNARPDESGIIYCRTKKQLESLYQELVTRGIPALPYHADLDDADRKRNQQSFINGDVRVMVATIAFGMESTKKIFGLCYMSDCRTSPNPIIRRLGARAGTETKRSVSCFSVMPIRIPLITSLSKGHQLNAMDGCSD